MDANQPVLCSSYDVIDAKQNFQSRLSYVLNGDGSRELIANLLQEYVSLRYDIGTCYVKLISLHDIFNLILGSSKVGNTPIGFALVI